MINLKVEAEGVREVQESLSRAFSAFRKDYEEGIVSLTEQALLLLKRLTPMSEKPGPHLADMWEKVEKRDVNGWLELVSLTSTTENPDLIWMLEKGTSAHEIFPKPGTRVLAFEVGGKTVFARHVFHPGTKPYGFISATSAFLEQEIEELKAGIAEGIREELG